MAARAQGAWRVSLDYEAAQEIRRRVADGESQRAVARSIGVSGQMVSLIVRGLAWTEPLPRGGPRVVLRDEDVVAILASTESHKQVAELYGVTREHIGQIRSGRAWKRLTADRAPSALEEVERAIAPLVRRLGARAVAEALRQLATSLDERRPDAMSDEEWGVYDRIRSRIRRRVLRAGGTPGQARAEARAAALEAVSRVRQGLPEEPDDRSTRRTTKRLWTDAERARIDRARDAAYEVAKKRELAAGTTPRTALLAAQAAGRAAAAEERERIRAGRTKRRKAPRPKAERIGGQNAAGGAVVASYPKVGVTTIRGRPAALAIVFSASVFTSPNDT